MTAFGENKENLNEDLVERMRQCASVIIKQCEMAGFSHWEAMATCGTLYTNYLRRSQHRDMAIRDAEALVEALKHEPPGEGTDYGSY
jgi:hypothetical protein